MKMKLIIVGAIVIGVIGCFVTLNIGKKERNNILKKSGSVRVNNNNQENNKGKEKMYVVPTMLDEISDNSSWCGTFQLVWNDMVNEVVKKDVFFSPQEKMAQNLNKQGFTEDSLSNEHYYKKYGLQTYKLKEEIEKGIKEKFNQTSDILEQFTWSEETKAYFFYTMLYREFEYNMKFDKLKNASFGDKIKDVKYFGITDESNWELDKQIKILYYKSQGDFAVLLKTKSEDEVIFCKNPKGKTFKEIYKNMNEKAENYMGGKYFREADVFKAPYIKFDVLREYNELQGKSFKTKKGEMKEIEKALQTIKFSIDEKGGKIKSEAGIAMVDSIMLEEEIKPRYFYVDNTFALFLREKDKELPYFAAKISDIKQFQ